MKIKNVLIPGLALVLLLLVVGCGGSSNSAVSAEQPQGVAMVLNQEYEVAAGDTLIPADEATRITVRHVFAENKKYVTLLAGSARLVVGADAQR